MSCGPSEQLKEMAGAIAGAQDLFDSKIESIVGGAIGGIKSIVDSQVAGIKGKIEAALPEIKIPPEIKGIQKDVEAFAGKLLVGKLAAADLANEITNLKTKYGDLDLGDIDLEDLPNLLRTGALDLENICKKIPNFEGEGVDIVLKGTPISFPKIDAVALIKGAPIPEIPDLSVTVDIQRMKKEAEDKFINITKPTFFNIDDVLSEVPGLDGNSEGLSSALDSAASELSGALDSATSGLSDAVDSATSSATSALDSATSGLVDSVTSAVPDVPEVTEVLPDLIG